MKLSRIACFTVLSILVVATLSAAVQAKHPDGWEYKFVYDNTPNHSGKGYHWVPGATYSLVVSGYTVYFYNMYGHIFDQCSFGYYLDAQSP